jgi:Fe-S cluster assembly iron-binding protein IscA
MNISDSAKEQFKQIGGIIKYSLNGGGCSGLIGKWELIDKIDNNEDVIIWRSCEAGTEGGIMAEQEECLNMFVIDSFSLEHMDNATIDYTGGSPAWINPVFKVIIPNKASCGCGESFVL